MSRRRHDPKKPPRPIGLWLLAASVLLAICLIAYVVFFPGTSSPSVEPTTPDLRGAMALLGEARLDEAEGILRTILHQNSQARPARDELRWIYFNQFRRREVEAILEDGLRRNPEDRSLAVDLMMSEFRPQNPRESVRYWERIDKLRPGQAGALAALGYCYWKLGRLDDSRRAIQAALDLRPSDFRLQLLAAEFLIDSGSSAAADPLLRSLSERATSASGQEAPDVRWDSPEI